MEKLKKLASDLNISLDDSQLQQFNAYYELLVEKNKVMNLLMQEHLTISVLLVSINETE